MSDYGELVAASCACGFVAKGELSGEPRRRPPRLSRVLIALGIALLVLEAGVAVLSRPSTRRPGCRRRRAGGAAGGTQLVGAATETDWTDRLAITAGVAFVVSGLIALDAAAGEPDGDLPRRDRLRLVLRRAPAVEQRLALHHRASSSASSSGSRSRRCVLAYPDGPLRDPLRSACSRSSTVSCSLVPALAGGAARLEAGVRTVPSAPTAPSRSGATRTPGTCSTSSPRSRDSF